MRLQNILPSNTISYRKVERGEFFLQYVLSKKNVAHILANGICGLLHNYLESLVRIHLGLMNSVAKEECSDTVNTIFNFGWTQ